MCPLFFDVKSLGDTSYTWVGYKGRLYSCCTVKYLATMDCYFLVNRALFPSGREGLLFSLNSGNFISQHHSVGDSAVIALRQRL